MNSVTQPIFIFASSWRSGSTLLQRFVTATGEVLVWGETGGALNAIAQACAGWEQITADSSRRFAGERGGKGEAAYQKLIAAPKSDHANQWIANLSPPHGEILDEVRTMFGTLYRERALRLGYPRYGFKETRCDLNTARQLQTLFPQAHFIFLVRNPMDVMLSIKRRDWLGLTPGHTTLKYYADHWRTRSQQFRQATFGLVLRYEDFVAEANLQARVLDYLGVSTRPSPDFVHSSRTDWRAHNTSKLSAWEHARLRYWLRNEMRQWGY